MKTEFAKWIFDQGLSSYAASSQDCCFDDWLSRVKESGELYRRSGLAGDDGVFVSCMDTLATCTGDLTGCECDTCAYQHSDDSEPPCSICSRYPDLDPAMEIFHADHHRKIEE